ncbi:MAG: TRAP transporter substrate-binding protein DctP [Alphaproteobacteria bacterium]
MTTMKAILTAAIVGLALSGGVGVREAEAQEVTLKALTFAPANKVEESMEVFRLFIQRVNDAGKGQIKIDLIGGPEVVPVGDQVNAVSKGVADLVMTFTVHAAIVPEVDTTGLSDITPAEERKVGYMELLDQAHKKINIKVIGRTSTNSGFYIFSKDPIRRLADFKGMKIRSHSGYDPLFKAVGAVTVGMGISEIYAGLERGVVRAAPYPLFVYDLGLHEVTKYVLADAFWPSHTTLTFMNRRKFEGLPAKLQSLILDTQIGIEKDMPGIVEQLKEKEIARLKKAGMEFINLPPDEAKKWRRLANQTRFDALSPRIPAEQMAKIKSMIVRE